MSSAASAIMRVLFDQAELDQLDKKPAVRKEAIGQKQPVDGAIANE